MVYIFLWVLIWIVILWIILLFLYWTKRKPKLSKDRIWYYQKEIKKCVYSSPQDKIIQYDKILNYILKDLWYEWNLADQLKQNPKEIKDIQTIWKLHKLRNRLAHELSPIANNILLNESKNFEKELFKLLEI